MSRARVVVTRKLPDAVEERLRAQFTVALNPDDTPFTPARLERALAEADGLLPTVTDQITAEMLAGEARKTQIIANFGVGVNNIDLEAAEREGVIVANTPDVLTDATADVALLLILAVTRRAWETESMLRRGEWTGFKPNAQLGMGLQGKTLGIVGMGRIGRATARRALGFGMKVIYFNRSPIDGLDIAAEPRPTVHAVLSEADVVSLHCPGGGANRGLISAERLALMKPTAYLVNTARGDIVDEPALIEALRERQIAGAGLDVYAGEPAVPPELLALPNAVLLPHIGSATLETRTAMGMLAADNLIAHFEGKRLPARVV